MATFNDYFPGRFMAASDLDGDLLVVIDRIEKETFPNDGSTKPVMFFRGHERGLVVNKTNITMPPRQPMLFDPGTRATRLERLPKVLSFAGCWSSESITVISDLIGHYFWQRV